MTDDRNADFRLVGGDPALDLVNTVEPRIPGRVPDREHLASPADLLAWAQRAGVVDAAEAATVERAWAASPATAAQATHAAIDVRESAYTVLTARLGLTQADPTEALERLSLRWVAAAARSELVLGGDVAAARLVVGTSPGLLIPDRLAHAAVQLLRTADLGHLRVCPVEEGGCGWLFLDRSRNGSRRWCAMEDCGAQAKARRLTARRRAIRASSVP